MDKHSPQAWSQAISRAEAEVYTLDNRYLTQDQKTEVECWYQFPSACTVFVFLVLAMMSPGPSISWRIVIGVPLAINAAVGLLNWYLYPRRLVYVCSLSLFHPWVLTLIALVVAAYLFYVNAYVLAVIAFIAPLGLLSIAEPHMWLYAFLARRYGMHPKYAFFKRFYDVTFPFEKTEQEVLA